MLRLLLGSFVVLSGCPLHAKVLTRSAAAAAKTAPSVLVPAGSAAGSLETSFAPPSLAVGVLPAVSASPVLPDLKRPESVARTAGIAAPVAAVPAVLVSAEKFAASVAACKPEPAPKFARAARALPALAPPNAEDVKSAPGESLKTASLSFFAGNGASARPDVSAQAVPRSARNRTLGLLRQYRRVRQGKAGSLPKRASRYRYLLVPGLSYDAIPDYMEPNLKRLAALGLDAEKVETRPFGDPAENAKLIAERVRASKKPVVLIAHSKGGIDSLEAMAVERGVAPKIARFVAIQSPYFGSALADWFVARPFLLSASMGWLRVFRGNPFSAPFPWTGHAAISKLAKRVRCVLPDRRPAGAYARTRFYSVVSRIDGGAAAVSWPLWMKTEFIRALSGKRNDGIIVPEEAVYPDSDYAWLENVGHVDTVADDRSWKGRTFGVRAQEEPFAELLTEAIVRWMHEPRPRAARMNGADGAPRGPREEGLAAMLLGLAGVAGFMGLAWWGLGEAAPVIAQAMAEFERFLIDYARNPF